MGIISNLRERILDQEGLIEREKKKVNFFLFNKPAMLHMIASCNCRFRKGPTKSIYNVNF